LDDGRVAFEHDQHLQLIDSFSKLLVIEAGMSKGREEEGGRETETERQRRERERERQRE
jgi:hypothetical protein